MGKMDLEVIRPKLLKRGSIGSQDAVEVEVVDRKLRSKIGSRLGDQSNDDSK